MRRLAQSTAYTVMLKLFLSSDHVSAATGKTVAIKISKAGGAFADPNAGASNATEVSNGWYKFALDATDTNTLGDLVVRGTAASCDDSEQVMQLVKATNGGLTALPDAAAEAAGGLYTRGTGAGQINQPANGMIDANVVRNAGTAITAASGIQEVKVASIAANAITATAIAADAITDAKVASDVTIASVTGAVGSVTGNVGGNVTGSVGSVAAGGITSSSFAAGAIDNAAIATDAIGSAELAASAVTEIQSGLATASALSTTDGKVDAIKAKTDNLPSDPADASDVAAAITAVQNHGDTYWLTATGFSTSADITGAVSTLEGYGDTHWSTATGFSTLIAADVEAAVLDAVINDHLTDGTVGKEIYNAATFSGSADSKLDSQVSAADVTAAVWDVQLADHVESGSMGQSQFYAQQGATSADTKATDIYGDTQAIRGVTDGLAQTGGKLWVLDDEGNALRHSDAIASDFATLSTHGDGAWATADVSDLPTNAELASAIAGIPAAPTAAVIADEVETRTIGADIKKVNGVTVTGNGTTGNEWGPA